MTFAPLSSVRFGGHSCERIDMTGSASRYLFCEVFCRCGWIGEGSNPEEARASYRAHISEMLKEEKDVLSAFRETIYSTPFWRGPLPPAVTFWPDDRDLRREDSRILLFLSEEDAGLWDQAFREDRSVEVLDRLSRERFRLHRWTCDLGCRCAALAEWVQS